MAKRVIRPDQNENFGRGSSGSWRDTEVDTTKSGLKSGDQVRAGKLGFRGEAVEPGAHGHKTPVGVRRGRNGNVKPMKFVSLHHHSTFSYGDGYQLPDAHARRAAELQMDALAMTEHGNMSSHTKHHKACEKLGVKPLFGVELYTGAIDPENRSRKKNHLTVIAQDDRGYRNLIELVSRSYAEGFYSEPTVTEEMLCDQGKGILVLSGCQGSLLFTSLVGGKLIAEEDASYKRALRVARNFKSNFGERYFIEVQAFPELEKTCVANPQLERISRATGVPLVASLDCHYTAPEEAEVQKILHNTRPGEDRTLEEMERDWGYEAPLCPPINDNTIFRRLVRSGLSRQAAIEAILNTRLIAEQCTATLPTLPMVQYPLPPGYSSARELWRDWLKDGWRERGCNRLPKAERERYAKRLRYEMEIIESKGFENLLLMTADAVKWSKANGVGVGPARGSAAASLAVYLLRITEVNPMLYPQLVFERFISPNRVDLPDIDLDFDSEQRYRLREYMVRKYGENMVHNLGTFTYYRSKNSLDDVARVFRVPKWEVETIKGQLIERSSGDLRASATIEDTVEQFPEAREVVEKYPDLRRAMDLEGNVKGFGVHAAGLIIGDVQKVAPVIERAVGKRKTMTKVVSVDLKDAETLGLLKMDFLGLSTVTMLNYAREWLGWTWDEVYNLPLDDKKTLDGFQRNDVIGIFQYEGQACRLICGELKPDNFAEVCDIPAIARPGPLHNGAAEAYVQVKRGDLEPERWHASVDEILEPTKFQIVYQEQILRIVHEVGDFDWTATSEIRTIIAKKHGEQAFNRKRKQFLDGVARSHPDFERELAERLWGSLITAGAYSFNFAHSLSYGLISYWTMFLKQNHPEVFYAAALRSRSDDAAIPLLRDADRHGIRALPPSLSRSDTSWTPRKRRSIRMGLQQIKGLGEKSSTAILDAREKGWDWDDISVIRGIGPKTIECCKEFIAAEDPLGVFEIDRRLAEARELLDEVDLPAPTHTSLEVPYGQGISEPVIWMGVVHERNLRDMFESNRAHGVELDPKQVKDPHLREFVLMVGDDGEELLRLRFDRWKYPKFKRAIWGLALGKDVVWVQGTKPKWRAAREIYVSDMVVIDVDE